ncbi:T9SS type A sorting domain-containing protein [candidate division KSB1 bacterium]|nr:T9SS type A sorting domain-containing protein [candidate division KSB1 bacterium]
MAARVYSLLILVWIAASPLRGDEILFDDPLNNGTSGELRGAGEFIPGGGWRSTGGNIVYDTGRQLTNGVFEATLRGWTAPAGGVIKSHPLSGWEAIDQYTHYAQTGSFWNWRIGTGYDAFKVLAAPDSISTRVEARVGSQEAVNDGQPHVYRVEWKEGTVRFIFDDSVLQEWSFDRFSIRSFTVGKDDFYPLTDPAPIISNIRIIDCSITTGSHSDGDPAVLPNEHILIYPNPFNSGTRISVQLPQEEIIELYVGDLLGRRLRTLVQGRQLDAGRHFFAWDGHKESGQPLPSGVYWIVLQTRSYSRAQKALLIR